jgi:chemotaxis protein methyltransferase CheR
MIAESPLSRTIEMTEGDFENISRLVYGQCGITLSEGKKELVKARLGKRIRGGQFRSFSEYYRYVVEDPTGQELVCLLDAISTNFTSFFREKQHFDFLQSEIVPDLMARKKTRTDELRFWSAGCSSGEEPYSIAIALSETIGNASGSPWTLLATDISTKVLKVATSGMYPKERIQSVPMNMVKKYFLKGENRWKDYVKVKDHVKRHIHFHRLNLMEPFLFKKPLDCIFCRNVMIYFDKKTQGNLANRFYECLERGGYLVIGHSESLTGVRHSFDYLKPTIYRKPL